MQKRGVILRFFTVFIFSGCCTATSGIYGLAEEERLQLSRCPRFFARQSIFPPVAFST